MSRNQEIWLAAARAMTNPRIWWEFERDIDPGGAAAWKSYLLRPRVTVTAVPGEATVTLTPA